MDLLFAEIAPFLDIRAARMLHPPSSRSLGCPGLSRDPSANAWDALCVSIVTAETSLLILPSRIEAVNEAAATVARLLTDLGITDDVSFGIDLAVREAVTNAVLHGNQKDASRIVEISIRASTEAIEVLVHDEGHGFRPEQVPDPTESNNILKSSGRGIFFMRNFMDEVEWFIAPQGGTTVRMFKKL